MVPGADLTAYVRLMRTRTPELRVRTPHLGLWLDTGGWSVERTVAAILAGRERARVA